MELEKVELLVAIPALSLKKNLMMGMMRTLWEMIMIRLVLPPWLKKKEKKSCSTEMKEEKLWGQGTLYVISLEWTPCPYFHVLRFEIEKKLKAAKRKEQHKKKSSHKDKKDNKDKGLSKDWGDKDLDKDVKERSKERKKTVEENKGKTDKKAQAMNALKARREEKKERGTCSNTFDQLFLDRVNIVSCSTEEKEKQRIEDRKNDDKDGDLDGVSADANKKKLKASDVYSDDSGSDSDSGSDFSTDKHGAAGKSSFPSSSKRQQSSSSSSSSDSDVGDTIICWWTLT